MAYMASALSFSLTNIGKPVIITGAQIPIEAIHTDGRNNIVNALHVATMDLGGVFIVFGNKVIL
jgi:L-asparaginase